MSCVTWDGCCQLCCVQLREVRQLRSIGWNVSYVQIFLLLILPVKKAGNVKLKFVSWHLICTVLGKLLTACLEHVLNYDRAVGLYGTVYCDYRSEAHFPAT